MTTFKCIQIVALAWALAESSALLTPSQHLSASRSAGIKVQSPAFSSQYTKQRRVNITSQQRKNSSTARCSAVSSAAVTSTSSSDGKRTLTATLLLIITDIQLRSLFTKYSIAFPSSLAGCGALFLSMLALDTVSGNNKWGEKVYQLLNPGATLLAKWLPVFFVPSLITLPLASGLGDPYEVSKLSELLLLSSCCMFSQMLYICTQMLKIITVIIGGFFFTLFSTSYSVLWVQNLSGVDNSASETSAAPEPATGKAVAASKPFSLALFRTLKSLVWTTRETPENTTINLLFARQRQYQIDYVNRS